MNHTLQINQPFVLESGEILPDLTIAYQTLGQLNKEKNNAVWVFHALTANADAGNWWKGLVGNNAVLNPAKHFIVCANVLGSPYGSTAPENLSFPHFTVRDVVKAHLLLATHLQINQIYLAIGGSFGGNQALEFAYMFGGRLQHLVLVACAAKETAWGQAIHEAQRLALQADPDFGQPQGGQAGLRAARGMALLQYRTPQAYIAQQTDTAEKLHDFKAASYIRYQGQKLVQRFTALSFYYLTHCLDTHHIGRGRGGEYAALQKIDTPTLAIAIKSDGLVPPNQTRQMALAMPNAICVEIESDFGHDGFLIETQQLSKLIKCFMDEG